MVGSRKLSNDEVEALLSGLDEDSKQEATQQFDQTKFESSSLVQRTFLFSVITTLLE